MNDQITALIRTWIPIWVGTGLTLWARRAGIIIDESTVAETQAVAVALVSSAYYAAVRTLETRWPVAGRLLGVPSPPVYGPPTV
ncbi:MAG: hypothetical protein GY929_24150 [Actinomycetia bacterium]|nr:hypothetical protein [Actinomycetes bacterium]